MIQKSHYDENPIQKECKQKHFRVKQSLGYHSELPALSCTSILVNTSKVLGSGAMSFRNWANEMGSPRYMIGGHSLGHAEGEKRNLILFISVSKMTLS